MNSTIEAIIVGIVVVNYFATGLLIADAAGNTKSYSASRLLLICCWAPLLATLPFWDLLRAVRKYVWYKIYQHKNKIRH